MNLLSLNPATSSARKGKEKATEVCRHMLAGGCFRSDCWFSHDLSATVCKFFLQGFCVKGEECPFLHDEDEISRVWDDYEYYEDEPPPPSTAEMDYENLENAFPSLTEDDVEQQRKEKFDFWGPTIPFSDALKKKPTTGNGEFNAGVARAVPSGTAARYLEENSRRVKVNGMKWLNTGGSVDALYTKHRKEAAEVAEQRNKLFQRAAEAFRSGNTAAAKTFSVEARKLDAQMQQMHSEASALIFEQRNRHTTSTSEERVIDLHGLHGDEGIYYLDTALAALTREKFHGTVTVITGTGHHSRGSLAKIAPQIRDHFRRIGLAFQEGTLEDGRGGIFILKIK
ncbi:hypothetical protein BDR26DRAFT_805837 [Obelidium mucronatum]|nr:hypothetical protein BDR26DRAFT_805837 [Obelidium mucronatum]